MICKHIVHCHESIKDPLFFSGVRRQRSGPFWIDKQLVILPEYKKSEIRTDLDSNSDSESDIDPEALEEDKLVMMEDEPTEEIDVDGFLFKMQSAMDICREQNAMRNIKFVKMFMASNMMNETLVEEIQKVKSRRTMPMTWTRNKHPATMYYR